MRKIFLLISCAASLVAAAQSPSVKLIHAGRLIQPEKGTVAEHIDILVDHDTVKAVGRDLKAPDSAQVIDLSGYTVLPGLIDCHTHLSSDAEAEYYPSIFRRTPVDAAIQGTVFAKRTLLAGFTTVRDVGSSGLVDVGLRDAIGNGTIPGPRMFVAVSIIGATGGHADITGFSPYIDWIQPPGMSGIADGVDAVRKQVRVNVKYGADVIKFAASAGVLSEEESVGAPQYSQEEMNAIVDEAKRWGRKACAHAHGAEAIKMAIRAGVASVEHASLIDDEGIALMKQKGTYMVGDVYNDDYILAAYAKQGYPQKIMDKEKIVGKAQREHFERAVKAGVKMAFGTDAGVYPHGWNAKQFAWLVRLGMTPMQAIQAATVNAADLIGNGKLGSIHPGGWADIIAVKTDILKDISGLEHVNFVMKSGEVYKNEP